MTALANTFHTLEKMLRSDGYEPSSTPSADELRKDREELQLELLQETLRYCAANVPHYSQTWRDAKLDPEALSTFADLLRWPVLRKSDVRGKGSTFVSSTVNVTTFRCTSGTTATRMPLPVSEQEIRAIDQFGSMRAAAVGSTDETPFVLRVLPPVRRLAGSTGGDGIARIITTFLNLDAADQRFEFDYVDHLIQCLTDYFPVSGAVERVNVVATCPTFMARTITQALADRKFNAEATAVKHLVCSGGVVTAALCRSVEEYWRAPLEGFYSLAEVAGAHARCSRSGEYRFDIMAHAEILDPATLTPAQNGEEGVLVLTSLYPFQQAQPMIRYWTGDIFTKHGGIGPDEAVATAGIFRGRQHECVDTSLVSLEQLRPKWFGTADILEVLHGFPELPQFHKHPRFAVGIRGEEKPAVLTLSVESYPKTAQAERELAAKIRTGIAERLSTGEGKSLDERYVSVKLIRKGELRNPTLGAYPDR